MTLVQGLPGLRGEVPQGIDIPEQLNKVRAVIEQGKPVAEVFS
jgi:hypothetical protein